MVVSRSRSGYVLAAAVFLSAERVIVLIQNFVGGIAFRDGGRNTDGSIAAEGKSGADSR